MKQVIMIVLLLVMVLPVVAVGQQVKPLQFMKDTHDFGAIDQTGGPAVYQFDYTNVSDRPVKILNVRPSCGCTTPDWTREAIAPGKTGFVQASFDPKGRPGFFNKSLTITTDFDSNPIILQIKGNVSSPGGSNQPTDFPSTKGNLRLRATSFNMGKVLLKDEFVAREFPLMNGGKEDMIFSAVESPAYIRVEVLPSTIAAGQQGRLRVSYNGKLKDRYGFQSDNIVLHTNDVEQPDKSFSVYATLEESFPVFSPEELAKAPRLGISQSTMDFGSIKGNTTSTRQITLVNTGKTTLSIREVQTNCTCVKASTPTKDLKAGTSTTLTVEFNPQNRQGTQQKRITIYSNDPSQPVQAVLLTAQVD